jgi:DNA modification methylase
MSWRVLEGDCVEVLRTLDAGSVQTCVTSPPYWGLRDYGTATWEGGDSKCDHKGLPKASDKSGLKNDGRPNPGRKEYELDATVPYRDTCGKCGAKRIDSQLGLEPTPEQYVAKLVEVFREVRRVLRDDGTVWLNLGDSYWSTGGRQRAGADTERERLSADWSSVNQRHPQVSDMRAKQLVGIPWRVAFALQADGWWLRSDIIWSKPNPMPESVTDRPTRAHEYIFLLSKSARYFYDADAIREEHARLWDADAANGSINARTREARGIEPNPAGRNKRSVWTVTTQPYSEAHFATFPPKLVEPCILAGSPPKCCGECGAPWERVTEVERLRPAPASGNREVARWTGGESDVGGRVESRTRGWCPTCSHGYERIDDVSDAGTAQSTVLDLFCGSGTTGLVALRHNRSFIGIELNPTYAEMARNRIRDDAPLMNHGSEIGV